jgi:TonB-dependent receptor
MIRKYGALCSASVLALTVAGGSRALAQDTAPSTAQSVTAPSTAQSVTGAATEAPNSTAVTGVVVTGLRRSLQSAEQIKRTAPQQIDAIVAEDIGKLPDITVSDTAARIVGVQVDRGGGEANNVLVRGLPNFTTTYNGREIFTAEARAVALQDFPAGAIAAVEVFKTSTADLVEAGLAGEINVRSRKPFDFTGLQVAGSFWEQYESRSEHYNPNGNLMISDRWHTGLGEIGALVNFSYTSLDYLDSTRSNTDYVAQVPIGPGGSIVRFPDIQRIDYGEGERTRPSLNGALQWRPAPGLEFYAEGLWQGFRTQVSDRELEVPLYGAASYSNIVLKPGTNIVESLTANDPNRPDGFQGATFEDTNTYQFAIGGKYDAGRFHLSTDIAHTQSRFLDSIYSQDMAYASPQVVTMNTGVTDLNKGPAFAYSANPMDPSTYIFRGFFDRQLIAQGRDWQARLDGSYDINSSFLSKFEAGFRYVDRDAHFEDGSRYFADEGARIPLSDIPVGDRIGPSGFPGDDPATVREYFTPSYDGIRENITLLRAAAILAGVPGFAQGPPAPDPSVTYSANEKSYAGYAQVRYDLAPMSIPVDGVIGVRAVKTDLLIQGTDRIHHPDVNGIPQPDTFAPHDVTKSYTDILPNVSARVHILSDLQLRLSYTQTRTRPDFAQYNPGVAVDPPGAGTRNANGGNPNLNPLKSDNYDASLEYYFSRAGEAFVAIFRRDLNGFIQNYSQAINDPTYGAITIYRPYNTGQGRIDGVEAQVTSFLDFPMIPHWLRAFGFDANVTYLDAKTGYPTALGGATSESPIIGVSKWTYNLDGFYESGPLWARLSYNHRSDYPSRFEYRGTDTYSEHTQGIGRLDLSANYNVNEHLTLTLDATNLLKDPYVSYLTYGFNAGADPVSFPRMVRYEESVYSLGLRFRF